VGRQNQRGDPSVAVGYSGQTAFAAVASQVLLLFAVLRSLRTSSRRMSVPVR
jgi:hypothetical protein